MSNPCIKKVNKTVLVDGEIFHDGQTIKIVFTKRIAAVQAWIGFGGLGVNMISHHQLRKIGEQLIEIADLLKRTNNSEDDEGY